MPTAQLTLDVQAIESDGTFWVRVIIGGQELKRQGPFADVSAAEQAATKLIRKWAPATPSDSIVLNGAVTELTSDSGRRFIVDAVRAAESLLEDAELCTLYELNPAELEKIAANPAVIKALRNERFRRMRNGQAAKESAQKIMIRGPARLSRILDDVNANPRHVIESHRELRATAALGNDANDPAKSAELFSIVFHMGNTDNDIERIEKMITPRSTPPTIEGETTERESDR